MASHRKPKNRLLGGRTARTAATIATAAAASVTTFAQPGHADPQPTGDQIKEKVDGLYRGAEEATERYDAGKEKSRQLQQDIGRLQDEVARKSAAMEATRTRLGSLAAAQYRSGALEPGLQLALADDPQQYLEHSAMLSQVGVIEQQALDRYGQQLRVIDARRALAQQKLDGLREQQQRLAAEKADIQEKLKQARTLLARLTPAQHAELTAEDGTGAGSSQSAAGNFAAEQPASTRAAQALSYARSQLGKPYAWGAAGPESFDCSGLMQAAWRSAGVSLPRTTYAQIGAAPRVRRGELRPGDLVFYYSGISHVGIYAGRGKIIHAPHPGAPVRYAPVDSMPFAGAVRPA